MGKFCTYCGKELVDGECDCEQSKEARKVQKQQTVQSAADSMAAPAADSTQTETAKETPKISFAEIASDMKNLIVHFYQQPESMLAEAMKQANKLPQYLLAALFAVVTIILFTITGTVKHLGFGRSLGYSVLFAVAVVGLRAVYAAAVYGFTKNSKQETTFLGILGVFSVTFSFDLAASVLLFLFVLLSAIRLSITVLLLWIVMEAVIGYLVTWIFNEGKSKSSFYITLLLQTVLIFVMVLLIRYAGEKVISGIVQNMMFQIGDLIY